MKIRREYGEQNVFESLECGCHCARRLRSWLVMAAVGKGHMGAKPVRHDNVAWREFYYCGDCCPISLVIGRSGLVERRLTLRECSDNAAAEFSARMRHKVCCTGRAAPLG